MFMSTVQISITNNIEFYLRGVSHFFGKTDNIYYCSFYVNEVRSMKQDSVPYTSLSTTSVEGLQANLNHTYI